MMIKKGYIFLQILSIFFLGLIATDVRAEETKICNRDLSGIEAIINRPEFERARWGILVQDLDSGCTIYSLDAEKYFIPASNTKLLTTAAALLELGENFRITTPIYRVGKPPSLDSLIISGRGDPTLSTKSLNDIVRKLQLLGIKSIDKLIIDDSYFDNFLINPSWEWSDIYSYYATAVNSLILNENSVTLTVLPQKIGQKVSLNWSDEIAFKQWQVSNEAITTTADQTYNIQLDGILGQPVLKILGDIPVDHGADVWDLAIIDPGNYVRETFSNLLLQSGIRVNQAVIINQENHNSQAQIITKILSPPLPTLLAEINQDSNNLYAEAILKILGKKLNTDSDTEAIKLSLTKLKIDPESYVLEDGSGLSRHNLITPKLLVELLSAIARTDQGEIYRESLAIAKVNGTLKNRFRQAKSPINLWGKTGTLTGVASLSGYLEIAGGKTIVFSILVNNSDQKNKISRQAIDEIILLIQNSN